jgi:hypothetical protein
MYNKIDIQIEKLNIELGDILKDYDPFDDNLNDIEDIEDEELLDELEWWDLEITAEKIQVIRFFLPEETNITNTLKMESMRQITKRLDLYNRIRINRIPKEISLELEERLIDFMKYCNRFMNSEKWLNMKYYIQKRNRIELYDDFLCNRINQQLNECYTDSEDVQINIEIDNIDSLHYLFEINKKIDDLQHSNILKLAIMYRIDNPYFHMIDEIRDLYDMIITSEMNFYRTNLLKMLLELDIEEMLDI